MVALFGDHAPIGVADMLTDNSVASLLEKLNEAVFQNVFDVEGVFVAVLVHEGCESATAWFVCAEGGKFEICVVSMTERSANVDCYALLSDMLISLL